MKDKGNEDSMGKQIEDSALENVNGGANTKKIGDATFSGKVAEKDVRLNTMYYATSSAGKTWIYGKLIRKRTAMTVTYGISAPVYIFQVLCSNAGYFDKVITEFDGQQWTLWKNGPAIL